MATAQINVRLDSELKRRGDAALSERGDAGSVLARSWEAADALFDQLDEPAGRSLRCGQPAYEEIYASAMDEHFCEKGLYS